MTVDGALHILRNPWGWTGEEVRQARLKAADHIEAMAQHIKHQAAQIEALTAALSKANSQTEHFERHWYLRGDEIEALTKDAERWLWWREQIKDRQCRIAAQAMLWNINSRSALDAATDSAIKAKETK